MRRALKVAPEIASSFVTSFGQTGNTASGATFRAPFPVSLPRVKTLGYDVLPLRGRSGVTQLVNQWVDG
jgi:hypothetical protein